MEPVQLLLDQEIVNGFLMGFDIAFAVFGICLVLGLCRRLLMSA